MSRKMNRRTQKFQACDFMRRKYEFYSFIQKLRTWKIQKSKHNYWYIYNSFKYLYKFTNLFKINK